MYVCITSWAGGLELRVLSKEIDFEKIFSTV